MPRIDPNNVELVQNLSRFKITNLSLYGTGDQKVEISQEFIKWLTNELQPVVEFVSLKNLNLSDLNNDVWSKFLALCDADCKFSVCFLHKFLFEKYRSLKIIIFF